MNESLVGKSGIITGGTSGFGLEMVKALVKNGANVSAFSIDELKENEIDEINTLGTGKAHFIKKDITAENASEEMVDKALELFGELDFAIANAGFAVRFEEPLLEMSIEEILKGMRTQYEVFVMPFTSLALAAAKVMSRKYENIEIDPEGHPIGTGSIIVTLSEAALIPLRDDMLAYSAAKHATRAVMRSLAATLGPKNIRINGIAPGFADTEGPKKFYSRYPQIREDIEKRCHLKPSFIHPKTVVPALLYLLSDNYVTGETLTLDGGYNINMCRYFQNT